MKRHYLAFLATCLMAACSSPSVHEGFELSYWVDMDIPDAHSSKRGYWRDYESLPEGPTPSEQEIASACKVLSQTYNGDKLYLVYHRQFEEQAFKSCYSNWRKAADDYDLEIVPTFVLENYGTPSSMNWTDAEIIGLGQWCKDNGAEEIGIYDVYIRQGEGTSQENQMAAIKAALGDCLVRVGLQPGEPLSPSCKSGVEDTWTAECQGITDQLWETPVNFNGTNLYGRLLLESWVDERVNGEERRIVYDMIPVAWDYDKPVDEYHYGCPGDDAKTNDPTLPGRIEKCHKAISSRFPEGMMTPKFGGYSCDLHILHANSAGKPETPSFYGMIKKGQVYKGYFSPAVDQVAELYGNIKKCR